MSQAPAILSAVDSRELDRWMRALAQAQHGLVGRAQLRAEGVTRQAVDRRLRSPDWEAVTARVLRLVGVATTGEQRAMAATLDSGPGAVLSHRSAAALWGVAGFDLRRLHVSRPRQGPHPRTELAVVHQLSLPSEHCTANSGVPVTTLARTVVDLAVGEQPSRVERVAHAAVGLGMRWSDLDVVLGELPPRWPGSPLIRSIVGENRGLRPLGSGLEGTVLRVLRAAGLPEPRRQVDLGGDEWIGRVDFFYQEAGLVVEVNGSHFHESPIQAREDQRRTAALVAAGFRVLPLPEDLIRRSPDQVVRLVAAALGRAA